MKDKTSIALEQMIDVLSGVQAVFLDIIRHDGLDLDMERYRQFRKIVRVLRTSHG